MYRKFKSVIIAFLLMGLGLSIFNYIKLSHFYYYEFLVFPIFPVMIITIIVFLFLPGSLKDRNHNLTKSVLLLCCLLLGLNTYLTAVHFSITNANNLISEYENIPCEQMVARFDADKQNGNIKFFHFNTFYVKSMEENFREYGIEYFGMGSLVNQDLVCYNELVKQYLAEEKNMDIKELYN